MVEVRDTDLGYVRYQYGKACLPPQKVMDLMCNPEEQYERGINLSPMGTLNSPLIIPRAIRDGKLGTEIINGAYRLNDSQE